MLSNLGLNSPSWITASKSTTWHLKAPGPLTACALIANSDNAPAIPNSDFIFLGTLNVAANPVFDFFIVKYLVSVSSD